MRADKGIRMHCRLWLLELQIASPDAENAEGQLPMEQVRAFGFNHMDGMLSQQSRLFHKWLSWARLKSRSALTLALAPVTTARCRSFPYKLDPMSLQMRRMRVLLIAYSAPSYLTQHAIHREAAEVSRSGTS